MPGGYEDTMCDMCGDAMVEAEAYALGDELLCESCYEECEPELSEEDERRSRGDDDDDDFGAPDEDDDYGRATVDDDEDDVYGDDDGDDEPW